MITYSRQLDANPSITNQYLEDFRAELNFLPWVHQRRHPHFLRLLKKPWFRAFLADLGASAINQMVYRRHIGPKSGIGAQDPNWKPIADQLSELFDQRLQSLGYRKSRDAAEWRTNHPGMVLVVVVGCQTERLYRGRSRAALRLIETAELVGSTIIFSGANPTLLRADQAGWDDQAQIISEAASLRDAFEAEMTIGTKKKLKLTLVEESKSANTRQNIQNSFNALGEKLKDFSQLVVVSSLFHVPRLAREVEAVLSSVDHKFSALTLVGSELPSVTGKGSIKWHKRYVKSACFEALLLLFQDIEPEDLVRPPKR